MKNTYFFIRNNARSILYIVLAIMFYVAGIASHDALKSTANSITSAFTHEQTYQKPLTELETETNRVYASQSFQATSRRRAEFIAAVNLKNKHDDIAAGYIENALTLNPVIDSDVDAILPANDVIENHTPSKQSKGEKITKKN